MAREGGKEGASEASALTRARFSRRKKLPRRHSNCARRWSCSCTREVRLPRGESARAGKPDSALRTIPGLRRALPLSLALLSRCLLACYFFFLLLSFQPSFASIPGFPHRLLGSALCFTLRNFFFPSL